MLFTHREMWISMPYVNGVEYVNSISNKKGKYQEYNKYLCVSTSFHSYIYAENTNGVWKKNAPNSWITECYILAMLIRARLSVVACVCVCLCEYACLLILYLLNVQTCRCTCAFANILNTVMWFFTGYKPHN